MCDLIVWALKSGKAWDEMSRDLTCTHTKHRSWVDIHMYTLSLFVCDHTLVPPVNKHVCTHV